MNKKIKIISGIFLLGVITIAIVTPIVVVSQQNKRANEKIKKDKALFNAFNDFKINGSKIKRITDNLNIKDLKILTDLNVNPKLTIPTITADVTRKYAIKTNKITGIATVAVTFSATNGDNDTKTFTISGFKTTADENKEVANTKIATDKTLITTYGNQTISGTPDQITNGAVTKAELESLSGFNTLPVVTPDVTRTYNIWTDIKGLATVTVTFSATDGDNATETFTISGFKKISSEDIQKELNKIWAWNGEALSNLRGEKIYKAFGKVKIINNKNIIKNELGISISNQKRIKNILRLLDTDDIEIKLWPFSKSVTNNIKIPMKDEKGKIVSYDFNYRYPNIFGFLEVRKKSSNNDWNRIYNSFDWSQKRFTSIKIDDFKIDNLTKDNFFDEGNLLKLVSRYNSSKDSWREIRKDNKIIKIEVLSHAFKKLFNNPSKSQWHDILIKKYREIAKTYNDALSYEAVSTTFLAENDAGTFITFYKEDNKLYGKFLMKVSRKELQSTNDYFYLYQNIYFEIV